MSNEVILDVNRRIYESHFAFPEAPDMVFPVVPQTVAELVLWLVTAGFTLYALREWKQTGSPLAIILMIGGAIALFNEPIDDVLGLVHHPRTNQNIVIDTIGPVPMWGLPTYILFFGGATYLLLKTLQTLKFSRKHFWYGIFATFILDLVIEIPLLHFDLYRYYSFGETPMTIAKFPLYWLLINTTGPILCAAILFAAPGFFKGWRALYVLFLPLVTDAGCSAAVGLPVYSVIHMENISEFTRLGGAILSCAIGLAILDASERWMSYETTLKLKQRQPARAPLSGCTSTYSSAR